ncbi:MAG: 16S rRNA (cytosine(967)-C(5))-methyltransferase RsmB [Ruminococcaceae bacterium]|nr:16S rRNA (cytosine(967)-C(5))-methyltransferase RsmB [Oscillospiraceae bacterium]
MNSRETALKALYEIEFNGAYSNMVVKSALMGDISKQDKAFITQLVYGVVRYKLSLDYIISQFSSVKLKKLSKYVLLILRMGIYQLKYMDKVPESAAVNESVKLAKRYCPKSSGFVNAILHNYIKNADTIKYPEDRIKNLSVKYSFPENLIEVFEETGFGEDLLSALNTQPETTIRVNTLKCSELQIEGIKDNPCYEYAKNITGISIGASEEYNSGLFTVQDVAAMMAGLALAPCENNVCVDVCAAPGGKTTHLAELMKNKGCIYAFDKHEHKIEIIEKNAERMGIEIIKAMIWDSTTVKEDLINTADRVLADVPCSGLGIIRRKPDIKWSKDDISALPDIQYKILESSAKYLKVGGYLVYSTCTVNKRENEDVITKFVENNPEFEFEKIVLPSPLNRENNGYITLYPNIDNTDGFFISKIKRCK